MPAYCAPWPGNRKTTGRSPRLRRGRRTARRPARERRRPASASRGDHGAAVREPAPPDLQGVGDVGERRALGVRRRCVGEVGASRAVERRRRSSPTAPAAASRPRRGRRAAGGASSSTTCALVPPMPNELTPARRGAPRPAASRASAVVDVERAGREVDLRVRPLEVQARRQLPCSSASTVLIRPATPAAASRWPMLVFTEPERAEPARGRSPRGTPG